MKILLPDRFNVIRILREDEDSRTFLANDSEGNLTEVLVKIHPRRYCNAAPDFLCRQLSWFSGIRHESVSTIFDTGVTKRGDLYIVREFLPTSELFSTDNNLSIKSLIAAAAYLQSNGQTHGSIKPSNIFLNNGLVRLTDPCLKNGETRQNAESIQFSAPEVLRGQTPNLQSDLYSIGAVLYRVLTLRNLFEDPNLTTLRTKCIWASPMSIGNIPDVSKAVLSSVMKLLDKEPQNRTVAFSQLKELTGARPNVERANHL